MVFNSFLPLPSTKFKRGLYYRNAVEQEVFTLLERLSFKWMLLEDDKKMSEKIKEVLKMELTKRILDCLEKIKWLKKD